MEPSPTVRSSQGWSNHFKDDEENYSKGIKWYLDQMPRIRSDEIAIEKSPKYLIANRAPKRIKNLNKDIKDRFKLVIVADIDVGCTFRKDFLDG